MSTPPETSTPNSTTTTSTPPKGNTWICKTCTLINNLTATTCTACMAPRPVINYVPAARARTSSVTNWRDEYETWTRSYKNAAVPIELVSVGERSSSLCLSLAGHLTVIQCPTQSTSPSTSTSTSSSTHDTPFSIEVDFHDLDQQINTWITEQTSLTLAQVLDHLIITYQHIKNNKKKDDDEWGDGDTAIADGDDDWGDTDDKTVDIDGDSVMNDSWNNDTDMKHASTGDWDDDSGFIDANDDLNTSQQDHEKALRRRWLAKEAELRAKSKKKSILEDVEYKGSSKQIFTPQEISTMLINTLLTCKREATKNGLDVEPIDDNIFHWRLRYLRFSANTQIQKDLVALESMYGHAWIELEIEFDMHLYPFFPPTVKPVWPRLENFIMGRLVCLDVLLLSGWSPVRAISDIFASIYRLLSQYGSINVENPVNDPDGDAMKKGSGLYTDAEYQLWRLSMLTEIAPRANVLMTDKKSSESLELPKMSTNLVKQASWTKHKADDVEAYVAHLAAQRKKNEEIRQILGITLAELSYPTVNSIFISMLSQSCILPFLSHYLTCTNLVDIDRNVEMYTSVFALLRGMSCHSSLCQLLRVTKISSTNTQRSLQSLMQELWKVAKSMENNKNGLSAPLLNLIHLTHTEMETAIHTAASLPSDEPKLPIRSTSTLSRTTSHMKSNVVEEKQACPICNVEFARSEIERHVDACMDHMDDEVEIISTRSPSTSPSPTSSPLSTSSSSSIEMSICPICNEECSQSTIERHVDRCLTQTQQKHDERVAKDLAKIRDKSPKTSFFRRKRTSTSSGSTTPTGLSPTSTIKHRIEREEKQAAKSGPTETCVVCFSSFPSTSIKTHTASCWKCTICARAFDRNEIRQHVKECIAHGKIEEEEKVAIHFTRKQQGILNKMQLDAVCWIQQQAQKQSELAHDACVTRFKKLGKTEHDLKLVLRYIRNTAPIIIHLMADTVLPFLVKDTHYRNQFETNTSKGTLCHSTRVGWEDRMYNRIYHAASGFDRVKYGVLNVSNSPNGVAACRSYGDSYLLLQNVRLRTTFANMDTGSETATLASCEYYTHILNTFTDKELLDVWEVAAGRKQCMDSTATSTYKEIQIHGPVQLNRDVQAIVMNARHKNDKKLCDMLKTFAETNHIAVIWMDEKLSAYQ